MLWITPWCKWFVFSLQHLSTDHTHFSIFFLTLKLNISKLKWIQNWTELFRGLSIQPTEQLLTAAKQQHKKCFGTMKGVAFHSVLTKGFGDRTLTGASVVPIRETMHEQLFCISMSFCAVCLMHPDTMYDLLHLTTRHFMDTWQSRLPSTRKSHQKL